MQSNDDNHESFEPHADVHQNRNDENKPKLLPAPFDPKNLWYDHIATEHEEPRPLIRAKRTIQEMEPFIRITTIPGNEKFHDIGIANDRTGRQGNLTHHIDVTHGNEILELENRPQRNQQRQ